MTSIKHDLSNAQKWWEEVGQPSYQEASEMIEKDEAKRARQLIERRREAEYQKDLREMME